MVDFVKSHVNENVFMLVEDQRSYLDGLLIPERLVELANIKRGIGFDQLLWFRARGQSKDYDYRIFNADGSESDQCGNGALSVAAYLCQRHSWSSHDIIRLHTRTQIIEVSGDHDAMTAILGPVKPAIPAHVTVNGNKVHSFEVGNFHAVAQWHQIEAVCLPEVYQNVVSHFDQPMNLSLFDWKGSVVHARIYERGVGETHSCGSGVCCIAAMILSTDPSLTEVSIQTPGGMSTVKRHGADCYALSAKPHMVYRGSL